MALSKVVRFVLLFLMSAMVLFFVVGVAASLFLATRGPSVQAGSILWLRVPGNLTEHQPGRPHRPTRRPARHGRFDR